MNYIFLGKKITEIREISALIEGLQYDGVRGPERGRKIQEARAALEKRFGTIPELSPNSSTGLSGSLSALFLWKILVMQ